MKPFSHDSSLLTHILGQVTVVTRCVTFFKVVHEQVPCQQTVAFLAALGEIPQLVYTQLTTGLSYNSKFRLLLNTGAQNIHSTEISSNSSQNHPV